MTELDEWLRQMEKRMDKFEVTNGKLERFEAEVRAQFKSVELSIHSLRTEQDGHFGRLNGTVGRLQEAEIRRDEREKSEKQMMAQLQAGQRWWTVTAIAVVAIVVSVLDRIIT